MVMNLSHGKSILRLRELLGQFTFEPPIALAGVTQRSVRFIFSQIRTARDESEQLLVFRDPFIL
jgi:hypothetical protein